MAKSKKEPRRRKYTEETLKAAVAAAKAGQTLSSVSRHFGVPKSTLMDKMSDSEPQFKRNGPATILSDEEEKELVHWIVHMSASGFPITKNAVIGNVECLVKQLKRENPFTNNRPGRSWYESFMSRHPHLSRTIAQNSTFSRTSVTEIALRKWFAELATFLDKENVAEIEASRIFSCEEAAFFLSPKGERVLVRRGEKTAYNFNSNDERECLTVLFAGNAAGAIAPPMIMFFYKRMPANVSASIPESWSVGRTDNGWTTGESFFEYVTNVFYPWLLANKIALPVVLYVDGNWPCLTMGLSEFCRVHKIIIVALYPNATHIIQPIDVAFFGAAEEAWRKATTEWRMRHNGDRMKKEHFAPLLVEALNTLDSSDILRKGFQACGLRPFDPDAVNYRRTAVRRKKSPTDLSSAHSAKKTPNEESVDLLILVEQFIAENTLREFRAADKLGEWNGDVEDTSLFRVWSAIRQQKNLPVRY